MRFEVEPACESSASLARHWRSYDGEYSDRRGEASRQKSLGRKKQTKLRRKRNVWKLGAAHEQQPRRTKSLGGAVGAEQEAGPLTVGGKEVGGSAEGWRRAVASLRRKLLCQRGGGWWWSGEGAEAAAAKTLPPLPHRGGKESEGVRLASLSLCVPSAFSPPVCSSPRRLPPSPSAARKHQKKKI